MRVRRTLALLATSMLAVGGLATPALADGPGVGAPWIVSVGDSFISGENSCRPEFDKAVSRSSGGFNWHRETDFSKTNTSGRVVAADACASRGTIVHSDDERFCCARLGIRRDPSEAERNKSNFNPLVKGYATAGVARANIPPGAVACE